MLSSTPLLHNLRDCQWTCVSTVSGSHWRVLMPKQALLEALGSGAASDLIELDMRGNPFTPEHLKNLVRFGGGLQPRRKHSHDPPERKPVPFSSTHAPSTCSLAEGHPALR